MQTECNATLFEFEAVERRAVVADFDGGNITSNAGALLLGQVDRGLGLIRRFAGCFTDRRDPRHVEHRIETLVGQRISAWCSATRTSMITTSCARTRRWACWPANCIRCCGRTAKPWRARARSIALSTHPRRHAAKYHKIDCDGSRVDALLVEFFLEAHDRAPREIVLDLDNADIPLHGEQEGRFFHGYYSY